MENVTNLTELKARLEAETSGGNLTLSSANSADDALKEFLDSVPGRALSLTGTTLTLDESATTLTVAGEAGAKWAIRGAAGDGVQLTRVAVVYTQPAGAFRARFTAEGTVRIGSRDVEVAGEAGEGSKLTFALKPAAASPVALADMADFISGGKLGPYLPAGIDIFLTVPLSALDIAYGFRRTADASLSFTSDLGEGAEWKIIEDLASLKKIGVTLGRLLQFREGGGPLEQVFGNIHATLNIGQDFAVRIALQGQDYWEVEVIPADGNVLPGLETLAGLAGGESLKTSVNDGLESLGFGALSLDDVRIAFDINTTKLRNVRMYGHVTVEDITFYVRVSLPVFEFFGGISPGTPVDLRTLVGKYFSGAESFPEIDITRLDISAQTGIGRYGLSTTVNTGWTMTVGTVKLGFQEFAFDINKQAGGVTGSVEGKLTLAGVLLDVRAAHEDVASGWQFTCSTERDQEVPIGELIAGIASDFVVDDTLPGPIQGLTVKNLYVFFDTKTQDFTFQCESQLPVDGKQLDIRVNIELTKNGPNYDKNIGGVIVIGDLTFDLKFVQRSASDFFVATYRPTTAGAGQDVKELIRAVSEELAGFVPPGLTIELKDIIFGYAKGAPAAQGGQSGTQTGAQTAPTKLIFGFDIGTGINLSNLPLVGQEFPKDATVGVDDLQILFLSQGLTADEVGKFNSLIPQGVTQLAVPPAQAGAAQNGSGSSGSTTTTTTTTTTTAVVLPQGFNVSAKMNFGGSLQALSLPGSGATQTTQAAGAQTGTQTGTTGTTGTTAAAQPTDGAKWFTLQKSFGPVYFEKVGVQYKDSAVWFLLSASLSAAGLTLSLEGLGMGSTLDRFDPKFKLQGLGVDYKGGGAVEIGGTFLRVEATAPDGTKYDEYDGAAVLKAEALTLSAVGSYAKLDGHPSLFVYAVLDYPLGGPSFFFVTGLAAGFGYNRALVIPPIDKVAQFPLVAEAVNSTGVRNSLTQELQSLRTYIPPTVGEYFLAVGVKFTSFKLIDSFVLLTVSFGTKFEVDVLGLSTLVVPTPEVGNVVTPLAVVQMAVRATYQPDDGFLGVQAQLTPASYILSRDCRLTGGFAFYSWFSGPHQGEFVQTLGGYHPSFRPPDYYPQVPRLGFNWRVDDNLTLKGEAYYALTASALMAGGLMQATWQSGDLKARFTAAADFIISWKPYHYDAKISIEASVSYTFNLFGSHTINVDVGARLHIWGPEFSGTASIDISVISFDVSFGSGKSKTPQPISWDNFKGSFLPAADSVCGISLKGGLVSAPQDSGGIDWVVNPKEFRIVTDSVIPAMNAFVGTSTAPFPAGHTTAFGIGPMAVTSKDLSTSHTVTIRSDNAEPSEDGFEQKHFEFVPVLKRLPVGLWGQSLSPSINGQAFVENALAGFEIKPKDSTRPGVTADILTETLRYDPETVADAYAWEAPAPFVATSDDDAARREAIRASITSEDASKAREQLLSDLGVAATINLSSSVADSFTMAPLVGDAVPG